MILALQSLQTILDIPFIMYGKEVEATNMGTKLGFDNISKIILNNFALGGQSE